jgi:hypothetical protein
MSEKIPWQPLDYYTLDERCQKTVVGLEAVLLLREEWETFINKLQIELVRAYSQPPESDSLESYITVTDIGPEETQLDNVLGLKVTGHYTDYHSNRVLPFPLIQFWLRSFPRGEQVQITAKLRNFPELIPYFERILTTIAEQYAVEPKPLRVRPIGSYDAVDYGMWIQEAERLEGVLTALLPSEPQAAVPAMQIAPISSQDGDQQGMGKAAPSVSESYIFCKAGEFWEIAYQGPKFVLKDCKGLGYLAFLLDNPNKDFHVLTMVARVDKADPDAVVAEATGMTLEDLGKEGISPSRLDSDDQLLDTDAITNYKTRLEDLDEEIRIAQETRDTKRELYATDEKQWIEKQLKQATGLFGRKRTFSDDGERARSKIQQQIKGVLDRIAEYDLALYRHLKSAIGTGFECSYRPGDDIPWRFDPLPAP